MCHKFRLFYNQPTKIEMSKGRKNKYSDPTRKNQEQKAPMPHNISLRISIATCKDKTMQKKKTINTKHVTLNEVITIPEWDPFMIDLEAPR